MTIAGLHDTGPRFGCRQRTGASACRRRLLTSIEPVKFAGVRVEWLPGDEGKKLLSCFLEEERVPILTAASLHKKDLKKKKRRRKKKKKKKEINTNLSLLRRHFWIKEPILLIQCPFKCFVVPQILSTTTFQSSYLIAANVNDNLGKKWGCPSRPLEKCRFSPVRYALRWNAEAKQDDFRTHEDGPT